MKIRWVSWVVQDSTGRNVMFKQRIRSLLQPHVFPWMLDSAAFWNQVGMRKLARHVQIQILYFSPWNLSFQVFSITVKDIYQWHRQQTLGFIFDFSLFLSHPTFRLSAYPVGSCSFRISKRLHLASIGNLTTLHHFRHFRSGPVYPHPSLRCRPSVCLHRSLHLPPL